MLRLLLKYKKRMITYMLVAFMLTTNVCNALSNQYVSYNVEDIKITQKWKQRKCDVIIRVGEYEGKAGKRVYINNQSVNLPNDIPIRNDNDGKGYYISEYDINKKTAVKVYNKLKEIGVDAKLQIASGRSEDLNASARISNLSNPKLYLSLHHNSYKEDSSGYFAISNLNDNTAKNIAQRLSDSIKDNGQVPQMANRLNENNYIGELSHLHNSSIGVLMELGFFSNLNELEVICSDEYNDYIAEHLAYEIENILNTYWE